MIDLLNEEITESIPPLTLGNYSSVFFRRDLVTGEILQFTEREVAHREEG